VPAGADPDRSSALSQQRHAEPGYSGVEETPVVFEDSSPTRQHSNRHDVVSPNVLWLRLCAIAVALFGAVVGGRIMVALSAPVDVLLAIVAVVVFAYRFER
jgi:hypothetical protein